MLKKINMIIVCFFLTLTIKEGFLFSLYLPVVLFYLFKDFKNLIYIYPTSFVSILLFKKEDIIVYLIFMIVMTLYLFLHQMLSKKYFFLLRKNSIITALFIFIINSIGFFIYPKETIHIVLKLLYTFLSIALYFFFDRYLSKFLKDIKENILEPSQKALHFYSYLDVVLAILATLGASYLTIGSIHMGIIIGCYFAMYISRKFKNIDSLVYASITFFLVYIFFDNQDAILIMVIAGAYTIRSIYTIGLLNLFLAILIFQNPNESSVIYIIIMGISILFEIASYIFFKIQVEEKDEYKEIHQAAQKSINEEILKFAGFLDRFVEGFKNPKGFNEKLSNGIKTIIDKHCKNCPLQKSCFSKNKTLLYPVFKDILMLNEDAIYNYEDFAKTCYKYPSILNTSKLLNEKINYQNPGGDEKDANNYILLAQISGVSNALKNYVIDTTSKTELNYQSLYNAKNYLIKMEYYVTYYEIMRCYEHDFLIKIGIKNTTFTKIKPILTTLYEAIIQEEVSVELVEEENTTLYIHIMPKLIIDVIYAYGNLPALNQPISGDNYLVKEQDNGHILFAISDGMGKGYSAFYESDMTLHLVEDIIHLNIESSTALEILNTFYLVQDYLERYATLDFLDINRHSGIATFYKMGANTTYIFKANGKIEKIVNQSLPLGLDEEIAEKKYTLEDQDLIIMSSDGILENLIDNEELEKFIQSSTSLNPQQLVYEILNYTTTHDLKSKDDMTLIVLKIQRQSR